MLVEGIGEQQQELVSGAILKLLDGCQTHTLSLPTLIKAGQGDISKGVVALISEALRR